MHWSASADAGALASQRAITFRHPELVSGSNWPCAVGAENRMLKQVQHDGEMVQIALLSSVRTVSGMPTGRRK